MNCIVIVGAGKYQPHYLHTQDETMFQAWNGVCLEFHPPSKDVRKLKLITL